MSLTAQLDECDFASYTAILDGDLASQLNKLRALDERGCRYYIFIGTPAYYEEIFAFLERMKRNYVGFNSSFCERNVALDFGGAFFQYSVIAKNCGCKNFLLATTGRNFENNLIRRISEPEREEFRKYLYPVSPIGFIRGESAVHYFHLGKELMAEIMKNHPQVDAVAFSSDFHALGAAEFLRKSKQQQKVKLFGMGGAVTSGFAGVNFTSAVFDVEKGAEFLANNLTSPEAWEMLLPGEIVEYKGE